MQGLIEVLASGGRMVVIGHAGTGAGLWVVRVLRKIRPQETQPKLLVQREDAELTKALQECACKLIDDGQDV